MGSQLNKRDQGLVSASVEPWRIDRDRWKASTEKAEAERDAFRAALLSIRDDNVSSDLWLRQKAADALWVIERNETDG